MVASSDDRRLWILGGATARTVATDGLVTEIAVASDQRIALGGLDGVVQLGTRDSDAEQWKRVSFAEPVRHLVFEGENLRIQTVSRTYEWNGRGVPRELPAQGSDWLVDGLTTFNLDQLEHLQVFDAIRWKGLDVVATDAGAMFRRSSRDKWRKIPLNGMPCGARIAAIASFDGALWVGSFDRGLCRLTKKGWTRFHGPGFLASDMVHDMSTDANYLYVATHKGLSRVDKNGQFQVTAVADCVDNPRKKCPWHATVNGVVQDPVTGISWMADTGAVHRMQGRRWRRYYRKAGVNSTRLTRIAAYNGSVAVGTGDQGILLMEDGRNFISITDQDGLADNWVMDVHYDEQGTLWVATCTRGLSRYRDGAWRTYTRADGLVDDYILSVRSIRGRLWVGTLRGLSLITASGVQNFTPSNGLSGSEIHDVIEHRGKVYVATDGGLSVFRYRPRVSPRPAGARANNGRGRVL
jgi:ligand-binding sensor domain-containing protein